MPRISFVQPDGTEKTVNAEIGMSLMEVAVDAGISGIDALCGGSCMCATCQVHVDPAQAVSLPAPEQMERDLLSVAAGGDIASDSRLSCQVLVTEALDGLLLMGRL
jgi:ferredoxin, 2Fe-2S